MNKTDPALALLKCLWERRGYCSYHDFEKLGYSRRQFYHAAKALTDAGLIRKLGHGRYFIVMKNEWFKTILFYFFGPMSQPEKDAFYRELAIYTDQRV
ncbi:MAG: hypothetical protein QXV17_13280 [Candidatus Micrarchaeaceae archaeon]